MNSFRAFAAVSAAALLTACAGHGPMHSGMGMPIGAESASPRVEARMEARMKAMQEMHQKMVDAKTPAERQALMADHMKAMQDGMAMMKEMRAGSGPVAMGGMACMSGMAGAGKGMPADTAMMEMMMQMMMDRMPAQ